MTHSENFGFNMVVIFLEGFKFMPTLVTTESHYWPTNMTKIGTPYLRATNCNMRGIKFHSCIHDREHEKDVFAVNCLRG